MNFCPKCGNKLNESDKFCSKCGNEVSRNVVDTQQNQKIQNIKEKSINVKNTISKFVQKNKKAVIIFSSIFAILIIALSITIAIFNTPIELPLDLSWGDSYEDVVEKYPSIDTLELDENGDYSYNVLNNTPILGYNEDNGKFLAELIFDKDKKLKGLTYLIFLDDIDTNNILEKLEQEYGKFSETTYETYNHRVWEKGNTKVLLEYFTDDNLDHTLYLKYSKK